MKPYSRKIATTTVKGVSSAGLTLSIQGQGTSWGQESGGPYPVKASLCILANGLANRSPLRSAVKKPEVQRGNMGDQGHTACYGGGDSSIWTAKCPHRPGQGSAVSIGHKPHPLFLLFFAFQT